MTITYQVERIEECLEEGVPLLQDHWEEVPFDNYDINLAPRYDMYKQMDADGHIQVVTARDDGKLIAYFVVLADFHLHHKDILIATGDIIYVAPEHRRSEVGHKMVALMEKECKRNGISLLQVVINENFSEVAALPLSMGFAKTEVVYTKDLRGDK